MLASAGSLAQYLALSGGPFGGGWTTLIAAGVYGGERGLHIHCEGSGNGVVEEGEGVDCVGWVYGTAQYLERRHGSCPRHSAFASASCCSRAASIALYRPASRGESACVKFAER